MAAVAVEQELPAGSIEARLAVHPGPARHLRTRHRHLWTSRFSALIVTVAVLTSLGGGGLLDLGGAYVLQARAQALHDRWVAMRLAGIPDTDLAGLEREWVESQSFKVVDAAGMFWLPGGAGTIDRWQAESDAIWARDLSDYRSQALLAEQNLHKVLAPESNVERKSRVDAFAVATTPLDFLTLRDDWNMEARLVPIDKHIAAVTGALVGQVQQAQRLGIRSDPAGDAIGRASGYSLLEPLARMARAERLTRDLAVVQASLQGRLDAASVTQQNLQHAADEVSIASMYGIDISGMQARIANDRILYANAMLPAEFGSITTDAQQVSASADHSINVVLSQTHVISGVAMIYQDHPLSCEEAATSMALTHQGINLSQDQILGEVGADLRPMYVDAAGRVRWGNAYETFVGNVNGSESNYTGLGTFYPPLVRVARAHGANILAYGSMSAGTIYARIIAGHPVVAFATWDWRWHPRRDYLSFDGQWIPWIGPVYASHVYTVVGVSPSSVLVNDPIRGQYWISKGAFEAGYSDFQEAIVFA
ncbi:MAG TPA: C39 family peptidase [Candidatus Dormibacteraeota bacterium]|nr:C39 family peptidase [Candidatus Dormibacteraeota bacterium]